jgi:hypothetical protein
MEISKTGALGKPLLKGIQEFPPSVLLKRLLPSGPLSRPSQRCEGVLGSMLIVLAGMPSGRPFMIGDQLAPPLVVLQTWAKLPKPEKVA